MEIHFANAAYFDPTRSVLCLSLGVEARGFDPLPIAFINYLSAGMPNSHRFQSAIRLTVKQTIQRLPDNSETI